MRGFQKIANRVALGIILGATIVGAAIMMRVKTQFTLFGYPGLAIICFLIAAIGGVLLAIVMFLNDERAGKKMKGPDP